MNVLTVFAHPGSQSFCHAVLDRFDSGLRDAGHTNEIVNLYAIGFDPILRSRDTPSWLTETIPDDMLERMRLRENLLDEAGGPLKRFALKRLIGDRDARGIIRLLRERYQPKDVLAQQQKVARRHQRSSTEAHPQEGVDHPDDDLRQTRLRRGPPRGHAHGD
jgi:NAD(P)H dehydrogenase (quinone)